MIRMSRHWVENPEEDSDYWVEGGVNFDRQREGQSQSTSPASTPSEDGWHQCF